MRFLLMLFIIIPIIEMVVLIEVGSIIGSLGTIGLVVVTAVIGLWLFRLEGLATFQRVQNRLAQGELPETELLEGIMLLVGGTLLLTPGFVTDTIGFICLIPVLRRPLAQWILHRGFTRMVHRGGGQPTGFEQRAASSPQNGGRTIDGEYTEHSKAENGNKNFDQPKN